MTAWISENGYKYVVTMEDTHTAKVTVSNSCGCKKVSSCFNAVDLITQNAKSIVPDLIQQLKVKEDQFFDVENVEEEKNIVKKNEDSRPYKFKRFDGWRAKLHNRNLSFVNQFMDGIKMAKIAKNNKFTSRNVQKIIFDFLDFLVKRKYSIDIKSYYRFYKTRFVDLYKDDRIIELFLQYVNDTGTKL